MTSDDYNIIVEALDRDYSTDSPFRRAVEKLIAEKAKEQEDGRDSN